MDRFKRIAPSTVSILTRFKEVPRYKEGLYNIGHGVYAWMVPNGSWGESNAGLVTGNGTSVLIDTLWDVNYTRMMLEAMAPITKTTPIRQVINTHADGDHWWGNQLVSDAEIISSRAAYEEMRHIKPISLRLMGRVLGRLLSVLGATRVGHWFYQMTAPYDFAAVKPTLPTKTFEGELRVDVGGREVRMMEVGPAHTRGDILVHVPDARVVFCADLVFLESTPVMWAGPMENIFKALNTILEMDVDTVVPGHGPVTDKSGVRQVLAYWQFVEEEGRKCYSTGLPAAEAARKIVTSSRFAAQPFAHWNSPERMMTNIHTQYRHYKGSKNNPGVIGLLRLMEKQARLAHLLPDAQPGIMRKPDKKVEPS